MSPNLRSFVCLSQHPIFHRQWSRTYSALHDSRIHRGKLHRYLVQQISVQEQPLLVGDSSHWSRPEVKINYLR